jgi:hypothetical protein
LLGGEQWVMMDSLFKSPRTRWSGHRSGQHCCDLCYRTEAQASRSRPKLPQKP